MQYPNIIDVHTHIYPEKIAEKAIQNIGSFYQVDMHNEKGTSENLIKSGEKIKVSKYIVCSVATTVNQVVSINNFLAKELEKHKEFVGFATLHPDMNEEAIYDEVQRVVALGFKGIKLHPDFQRFDIDEEKALKIYRNIGDLPILFHTGDDRFDYSSPERLARVAKMFPNMTAVAAHFGGYCRWSEIDAYDGLDNVFFDTSSSLFKLPEIMAKDILKHLGYEKFMFGTDYPMWTHSEELQRLLSLNLGYRTNEDILYNNAKRILNI